MKKNFLCLLFCALLMLGGGATTAQPQDGGDAGNSDDSNLPAYLRYKETDINKNFAIPHRTKSEVMAWASRHISTLMSFSVTNVGEHFAESKKMFVKQGWDEFIAYVDKVHLRRRVIEGRYKLNSIVDGHIYIVRQGTVGGVYRWDVELPLLISFIPQSDVSVESQALAATANLKVIISITRVAEGGDEQLAISGWRVTQDMRRRIVK